MKANKRIYTENIFKEQPQNRLYSLLARYVPVLIIAGCSYMLASDSTLMGKLTGNAKELTDKAIQKIESAILEATSLDKVVNNLKSNP